MTTTLTPELRARLDAHLDAVDRNLLATAHTREQRRAITDDLESQILEMLAAKSATPTLADLEAVLAGLDPPAAYATATPAPITPPPAAKSPPPAPRYSRTAIWGLVCILVSFLPVLLVFPIGLYMMNRSTLSRAHLEEPAPALASERDLITSTTAPASPDDMFADRKTYTEFMSMLNQKQLGQVIVRNDGNTVTLTGKCSQTPSQEAAKSLEPAPEIFTTIPANEMDASAWSRLRAAAREAGTTYTVVGTDAAPKPVAPPAAATEPATPVHTTQVAWSGVAKIVPCFTCLVGPLALLGTILGWIAFAQIRRSKGALRGKGLALFDGLFYPIVFVLVILSVLIFH